jgi:hAT family C-terminal dimerisation region
MSLQQRMEVLRRQLTAYMSRNGPFANDIWASRKPDANVSVALQIANGGRPDGWWLEFDRDTLEQCRVATRVLALVTSSCPEERTFSFQKHIHSKVRNWLAHKTMRPLIFVHCNLNILSRTGGDEDLDFLESSMVAAVTCDESGDGSELADAGCDAESVMHLAEDDDNDDDDGIGESEDDSGRDDE